MNKEVKKLWVDALRSGKYKQGTGYLVNPAGRSAARYCCLGVLCELKPDVERDRRDTGITYFDQASQVLPRSVMRWAGFDEESPEIDGVGVLATLNDSGVPFSEIADLIEEHL